MIVQFGDSIVLLCLWWKYDCGWILQTDLQLTIIVELQCPFIQFDLTADVCIIVQIFGHVVLVYTYACMQYVLGFLMMSRISVGLLVVSFFGSSCLCSFEQSFVRVLSRTYGVLNSMVRFGIVQYSVVQHSIAQWSMGDSHPI